MRGRPGVQLAQPQELVGRSGWSVSLSHPGMAESRGVTPVSDDHLEEGCHGCMCLEGESGTHRTEVSAVLGMVSSVALF